MYTETEKPEGAARTTDGGRPLRGCAVTGGQEALAFSSDAATTGSALAAAGFGAGLAAS